MKKRIVIGVILIGAITSGICLYFLCFNKENNEKRSNTNEEMSSTKKVNDKLTFDLNGSVPTVNDFLESSDGRIEIYFNDELYNGETLDNVGEYHVKVFYDNEEKEVTFNVYDKTPPVLKLKSVTITEGGAYKALDFIESCEDNSKEECSYELITEEKYSSVGKYDIKITAKDKSGNEVEGATTLNITKEKPKRIETKKEVTTEKRTGKYCVTENVTITTTWDIYSDGTEKNKKTKETVKYDYSSYNAKAKDLLPEAKTNRQKYASFVNDILNNTNAYRREVNLPDLVLDEDLTLQAMARAIEASYTNKWDHTRPDGSDCFTISAELGMKDFWGENLAWGQKDGNAAAKWWRNSSGHYANMIGSRYTKLGVGVIKFNGKYWYVQVFA